MRMLELPTAHIYCLHIIDQGGLDLRVSHELHEGRQTDSGSDHVGGEGVAEAMRVSLFAATEK